MESKSFLEKLLKGPRLSRLSFKKKDPVTVLQSKTPPTQQHSYPKYNTSTQSATPSNVTKAAVSNNNVNYPLSNVALLEADKTRPTEVRLENGQAVVRPADQPVLSGDNNGGYNNNERDTDDDTDPKKILTSQQTVHHQHDSKPQNLHHQTSDGNIYEAPMPKENSSAMKVSAAKRPSSLVINRVNGVDHGRGGAGRGYSNLANSTLLPVSSPDLHQQVC